MPAAERSARPERSQPGPGAAPRPQAGPRGEVEFHDWTAGASATQAPALAAALAAPRASIAPSYFYDPLGSALFAAICELPEYYPTRTERAIFQRHAADIARTAGAGGTLIDLGAGDCHKAESLFGALRPACYVAVDVSVDYLRAALAALAQRHPALRVVGVGVDFAAGLRLPDSLGDGGRIFFYPGSSIGNFDPPEAAAFLRGVHAQAGRDGALLIGVDLVKPAADLQAAYDDALGVTAAFNRNALANVNRALGADFDVRDWQHAAVWNAQASRIEMHLRAVRAVTVRWPQGERRFQVGESIHTENSYKYTVDGFDALLRRAGWHPAQRWCDAGERFAVFHARAADVAGGQQPGADR